MLAEQGGVTVCMFPVPCTLHHHHSLVWVSLLRGCLISFNLPSSHGFPASSELTQNYVLDLSAPVHVPHLRDAYYTLSLLVYFSLCTCTCTV